MKKTNTPIFFIGGKDRGLSVITCMLEMNENLVGGCILNEDIHEHEKKSEQIEKLLQSKKIPYLLTKSVKTKEQITFIKNRKPKLIVVVGWRSIIPPEVLSIPVFGCVAIHESLLPKYRGFAPVNWAVINGEKQTGTTLFFLDEGLDSGDIVAQKKIKISLYDSVWDVYKKTSSETLELFKQYLPLLKKNQAPRKKQSEEIATYTCARTPNDGLINWNNSTLGIYNLIRGLHYTYPGAFTYYKGKKLFIWRASIPTQRMYVGRIPGKIVSLIKRIGVEVLTGDGIILLEQVQFENQKKVNACEIISSIKDSLG